ncbi:MAG: N-acetyltransferase [Leptothrix sp. (in: Bacteria)]|nr:N-acetyltransferase [Leptothrix sp. (in: b-proteobacteria)]
MSPLAHWRALSAEHGHAGVAMLYLLHRLLQQASGGRAAIVPYLMVAQRTGNPALADVKADVGTVVRRVGPDDPLLAAFPRPAEVTAQRFADGAACYAATVKGVFAGHIWIARGHYVEDEVRCTYEITAPTTAVWDFDVYIEPRFRLGRTMARLWKAVDTQLHEEGARWSLSRISGFNPLSLRSHARLGAIPVGWALFLVVGRCQLAVSSLSPWAHFSCRAGTRVRYQVSAPFAGNRRV